MIKGGGLLPDQRFFMTSTKDLMGESRQLTTGDQLRDLIVLLFFSANRPFGKNGRKAKKDET